VTNPTNPPPDRAETSAIAPDQGATNAAALANQRIQSELASVTGLTRGINSKPVNLDGPPAKTQEYNQDGFLGALVENVKYQGVQQTTRAIAQAADQVAGTDMADHVHIYDKPLPAAYKSSEWYGEQFGSAVGQIAPFLAAFAVTRGACAKMGLNAALEGTAEKGLLLSRNNLILTGQTAVAGFASSAMFTPNQGPKKNFTAFAAERLKDGTVGGLTMAGITAGTLSLKSLGTVVAKDSPLLGAVFRNSAAGAAIAGYPTGMLSAQVHARLFDGRSATLEEMQQSAFGMSVVGFGLGAIHGKATEGALDRVNNPTITDVLRGNFDRGYQHFDNFMASINPLLAGEPRLAYARAGGAPLRSMAMEATLQDLRSNSLSMMRDGDEPATVSSGTRGGSGRGVKGSGRAAEATGDKVQETKLGGGKPVYQPLEQVLRDLHLSEAADKVAGDKVLKNQKVVGSLGRGWGNDSPAVLELAPSKAFPDGGALKVSIVEGGWQDNWGKRSFDAKLLSKVHDVDLDGSGFAGSAKLYVQELVDTADRYDSGLVDSLFAKIGKTGQEFGDQGSDIMKQVGISRKTGDLVVIDYPAIDQPGTHETLRQLTEGHEGIEEGYEKENAAIKAGTDGEEKTDFKTVIDADREAQSQTALRDGGFTPREQELLQQLQQGIPAKEVLEFAAILDGKFTGKGMPDTKAVKPTFDAMVRRAQKAGVLEKAGKQAKMGGSSDEPEDEY
jgi:hypothetical protein